MPIDQCAFDFCVECASYTKPTSPSIGGRPSSEEGEADTQSSTDSVAAAAKINAAAAARKANMTRTGGARISGTY